MGITAVTGIAAGEAEITVTKRAAGTSSSGTSFSDLFTGTLQQNLSQQAMMSTAGASSLGADSLLSSSFSGVSDDALMSLIASAEESGSLGQTEIALFMLLTMMQSDSSSDFTPIMSCMASLIQSLGAEEAMREKVMLSDYDPSVLDAVDRGVFGNEFTTPAVSDTGCAIVPSEAWRPCSPSVVSGADNRSAETLSAVISQFNVETAERYRPYRRGNDTYCNIFVWDVTSAMGCEIPHFVDPDGTPRTYPDVTGAYELDANGVCGWLATTGAEHGWREVPAEEAQAWANEGNPAVTAFYNAGGIGHVQVVCPSRDGSYDPVRGVTVAQAGSNRYGYAYISSTYSSSRLGGVKYYIHD